MVAWAWCLRRGLMFTSTYKSARVNHISDSGVSLWKVLSPTHPSHAVPLSSVA